MTTYVLSDSRRATFDATGTATTLPFGPVQQQESWVIDRYSVSANNACVCRVYRTSVSPNNQIDYTVKGNGDTSSQGPVTLAAGQQLVVQWTGGTPGDVGTFAFEGTRMLSGDYGYHGA